MNINSPISILASIHADADEFLNKAMADKGITELASSHGNIMFQLNKNGNLSMSELSSLINRDKSTTTVLVKKLETKGLIKVSTSLIDKRGKEVSLTEEGKKFNNITSEISQELLNIFFSDFSDEDKKKFIQYLLRIKSNFNNSQGQTSF